LPEFEAARGRPIRARSAERGPGRGASREVEKFMLLSLLLTAYAHAAFTNSDLKRALAKSQTPPSKLLIYTWSPRMTLSIRGLEELMADRGRAYKVLFLLENGGDAKLARRVAKEKGWPAALLEENQAEELRARGSAVHFPSYQFLKNGKFAGPLQPGYRTPAELQALAKDALD
jgi:hypothetical protein